MDPSTTVNKTQELAAGDNDNKQKKEKKTTKKSAVRTKFLMEALRHDYNTLRDENDRLRELVTSNLPPETAEAILANCVDLQKVTLKGSSVDELTRNLPGLSMEDTDDNDDDDDDDNDDEE